MYGAPDRSKCRALGNESTKWVWGTKLIRCA